MVGRQMGVRSGSRGLLVLGTVCLALGLVWVSSAVAAPGDWPMWQHDVSGSRFNPDETTLSPANVGKLALAWSFAFPGADAASSQPAVVGDTLYVGGRDGYFYALDAKTGTQRWRFDTSSVTGAPHPVAGVQSGAGAIPYFGNNSASALLRDGPAVANGTVYFGDSKANIYALDASSGALRWSTKVDPFMDAIITSSPVLDGDRLFVGVSSGEEAFGLVPAYDCCHFRGSVVSLDLGTGKVLWRHYTIPEAQQHGTNAFGVARYEPSGAAVWASPAVDPATHSVLVGTGNPYTGSGTAESDSMLSLDEVTGRERWAIQLTHKDQWTTDCPGNRLGDCPQPGPDFDFAAAPNVFTLPGQPAAPVACASRRRFTITLGGRGRKTFIRARVTVNGRPARVLRRRGRLSSVVDLHGLKGAVAGVRIVGRTRGGRTVIRLRRFRLCQARSRSRTHRSARAAATFRAAPTTPTAPTTVVGEGQKSGVYHALDVRTGSVLWQTALSKPVSAGGPNFQQGVQWGSSYDGKRIYVATAVANPGSLSALDPATGRVLWQTMQPTDGCSTGGAAQTSGDCELGMPGAVSVAGSVVYEGSLDGKMRAFSAETGKILWTYDTVRSFQTTNGSSASGGSVSGAGAVISHGMVFVNSGYNTEEAPSTGIHGNVLLGFALPGASIRRVATAPPPRPLARSASAQRCLNAWNASPNLTAREALRARDRQGRPARTSGTLVSDDSRCLVIEELVASARHRVLVQLTLRGKIFKPVGQARMTPPPRRQWNLDIAPDGTIAFRPHGG